MQPDCSNLPFFPNHESITTENGTIRITWFEPKFSQCHYNYRNITSASNACTLIAILMASYCNDEKIIINEPNKYLNVRLIYLLAYSILDGNKLHENLRMNGVLDNFNLTVPEAMKFAGQKTAGLKEWKSMVYMESLFKTLCANMKTTLLEWNKSPMSKLCPELYIILIANNRSVLFIVQKTSNTVTLIDSHQHSDGNGAFIAVAVREKLNILCLWYSQVMHKCFQTDSDLYELSFLYFQRKEKRSCPATT